MKELIASILRQHGRNISLILLMVILAIYVTSQRPAFGSVANWKVIILNASFTALPALGTAFLMISGKVDLSVGSIFGFGGISAAWMAANMPVTWWMAILIGIIAGGLIGLVNGILVRRIPVSPLIVTLGSLSLLYGVNLLITEGQTIRNIPSDFTTLGRSRPLGIHTPVWVFITLAIVGAFILNKTKVGRHVFAIGGNEEAAATAGISVGKTVLWLFTLNGAIAAGAGALLASRLQSADANLGRGSELDILTAVILGGVAFTGGEGTIFGVILAVIFLSVIENALIALSIDPAWSFFVTGAVLVAAVLTNQLALEARERRQKALMLKTEEDES